MFELGSGPMVIELEPLDSDPVKRLLGQHPKSSTYGDVVRWEPPKSIDGDLDCMEEEDEDLEMA